MNVTFENDILKVPLRQNPDVTCNSIDFLLENFINFGTFEQKEWVNLIKPYMEPVNKTKFHDFRKIYHENSNVKIEENVNTPITNPTVQTEEKIDNVEPIEDDIEIQKILENQAFFSYVFEISEKGDELVGLSYSKKALEMMKYDAQTVVQMVGEVNLLPEPFPDFHPDTMKLVKKIFKNLFTIDKMEVSKAFLLGSSGEVIVVDLSTRSYVKKHDDRYILESFLIFENPIEFPQRHEEWTYSSEFIKAYKERQSEQNEFLAKFYGNGKLLQQEKKKK